MFCMDRQVISTAGAVGLYIHLFYAKQVYRPRFEPPADLLTAAERVICNYLRLT